MSQAALARTALPTELPPAEFEPISSTFDVDLEGWTSDELNAPVWAAPGYLLLVDGEEAWNYAVAPAKFRSAWAGAESILLSVLADPDPAIHPLRVMIEGSLHTLYWEFALSELAPGSWVALEAPLAAGGWRHFSGERSTGALATQSELDETLANVLDLRVRMDLNSKSDADELNGLDDVIVQ